mmetsp:Transcript_114206/g.198542  ORF Transcript_114206/g.198542 Transcript_114206/m.198542 type:complete len:243 (+) Transcript_114206:896-1624(+)
MAAGRMLAYESHRILQEGADPLQALQVGGPLPQRRQVQAQCPGDGTGGGGLRRRAVEGALGALRGPVPQEPEGTRQEGGAQPQGPPECACLGAWVPVCFRRRPGPELHVAPCRTGCSGWAMWGRDVRGRPKGPTPEGVVVTPNRSGRRDAGVGFLALAADSCGGPDVGRHAERGGLRRRGGAGAGRHRQVPHQGEDPGATDRAQARGGGRHVRDSAVGDQQLLCGPRGPVRQHRAAQRALGR